MKRLIDELKNKWRYENIRPSLGARDEDISLFQIKNNVALPEDLIEYFKSINGTGGDCTNDLYEFYTIERIRNIIDEFKEWEGIPNYRNLSYRLSESENIYVFANFNFNLFTYGIKLYLEPSTINEVFVICGEEYKKIADSFTEFVKLYLLGSIELQLNKETD